MCVEVLSKSYFTTNNANIAAVVVVVLRVAHLHRVVGNARASSVAAARLCPPPPPPRRTSSPAPSGRYQSPGTRSRARPVRTNYWSSMWMLLDATTPAFVWCLPGMMQGGVMLVVACHVLPLAAVATSNRGADAKYCASALLRGTHVAARSLHSGCSRWCPPRSSC